MVITLLRHGAPDGIYHGCYNGHTDISIDETLFSPIVLPYAYDIVYSSDLVRCTQTLNVLGYTNYVTDSRLREVCFKGEIEGKNFEEIERLPNYNSHHLESIEAWHSFVCDESIEAFRGRIGSFLLELPTDKNILICSHGGVIHEILSQLHQPSRALFYLESVSFWIK